MNDRLPRPATRRLRDRPATGWRRAFRVAACLAALCTCLCAGGEGAPVHPLDRTVTLDLWGAGLFDAANEIKRQTGVELLFYRQDIQPERHTDDVYLVTGRVPLRAVMECLSRRFALRYRLSDTGKLELSKGYAWAAGEPALRIFRLEGLASSNGDVEAVKRQLAEFVKPMSMLGGEYSLNLEPYPTPENPNGMRCVAVVPPVLGDYLSRAVRCLTEEGGDYPPVVTAGLHAVAGKVEANWEELLTRAVATPSGGDLRRVLLELAGQAGIAIVVRTPAAPANPPMLDLRAPRVGLGKASEELSSRYGLGRRVFLAVGALSFEGDDPEMAMDVRSRELYWDGLAVAGFDARQLAERFGGGDAIAAMLKREAFPHVWRDPACAIGYSPGTGRLAVVAPLNAVEAVAERLEALNQ